LFARDNDLLKRVVDETYEADDTTLTTQREGTFTLAISAADVDFAFSEVTDAKWVVIAAFDAVTVKVNGTGNTEIPLTPFPAATSGAISTIQKLNQPAVMYLSGTNIQTLHFGNPSGTATAEVYVGLFGEAS
jgi:hypothetical protein